MDHLKPVAGHTLLLEPPETENEGGVIVRRDMFNSNRLDFVVFSVADGTEGFGPGDTVLLDSPGAGRRVVLDGKPYRLVENERVIGVME